MTAPVLVACLVVTALEMPVAPTGSLEGRPTDQERSPLQARIDAAAARSVVVVEAGTYDGDLYVDRPLTLKGQGRPLLSGSGRGSVVRIRAAGVILEGFDIDGRGGGDLGRDASGVHVAAFDAVIRDCRIQNTLFGIYLRAADGARLEGNVIRGDAGKEPGEKGSGLHVFDTTGFALVDNDIALTRDGIYIQSSANGVVRGNTTREVRYGLHYMYSDDNQFEDNRFEDTDAGAVLMYSRRIVLRRNQIMHNRGFASVGLLFKACDDSVAEDNLIADNARGIFLEGSYRNVLRRNVIAEADAAIVLYDSCGANEISGNVFLGNLSPLYLVGRRTDTVFAGNYWSENDEPDLDGDGHSDRPYVLSSLFDHLRGNLTAADLMAQSLAARALAAAERSFPVLAVSTVRDPAPLTRPPRLDAVPRPGKGGGGPSATNLGAALALVLGGAWILAPGGRRRARRRAP
ncbi:MAG: nitrous oxide reductase family maturation protein NosD [Deltaproteobacteria bacterium]|nr:nitrous oxide reductase family maturation protein NosD [Deltaproteobacteria bacterium]